MKSMPTRNPQNSVTCAREKPNGLWATMSTSDMLIIAITGFARDEDIRRSDNAGIDEHLVKPVDLDRVLERLAQGRGVRNSMAATESDRSNSKEDPR